jgi:membrane fusion protein, multidrug efflux system
MIIQKLSTWFSQPWPSSSKKWLAAFFGLLFFYFLFDYFFLYCNDAYVQTDLIKITPRISGYIDQVYIHDNQAVTQGQPLIKIDDTPFKLNLDEKKNELKQANLELELLNDEIFSSEAEKNRRQDKLNLATLNEERYKKLLVSKAISQQAYDEAKVNLESLSQQLTEQVFIIKKNKYLLDLQQTKIDNLKLAVSKNLYELNLTKLIAPQSGIINHLRVYVGDHALEGVPLFGLIVNNHWEIVANYTESDLAHIKPGQSVLLYIPNKPWRFSFGKVVAIGHAVARTPVSADPALPYIEPVTNWIRYPYRFPVYIHLAHPADPKSLFMGMGVKTLVLP